MKRFKKSSILTLAAVVGFLMVLGTESSQAAVKCDSGSITFAGVFPDLADDATGTSKYMIQYICDDTAQMLGTKQFLLSTVVGDSGYATILTAISLQKKVKIQAERDGWNALVTRVNLVL